jgi:hypothetical protein
VRAAITVHGDEDAVLHGVDGLAAHSRELGKLRLVIAGRAATARATEHDAAEGEERGRHGKLAFASGQAQPARRGATSLV